MPFTFSGIRYVPALGVKAGETTALRTLKGDLSTLCYPLLTAQQVPGDKTVKDKKTAKKRVQKGPTLTEHLDSQGHRIADICTLEQSLEGFCVQRAMLDVEPLDRQKKSPTLSMLEQRLGGICSKITPVTGCKRTAAHQIAVAAWRRKHDTGIAIRVQLPFPSAIDVAAVPQLCATPINECDLIVDAGHVDASNLSYLQTEVRTALIAYLPLGRWRTVTVLSGAFPKSIAALPFDIENDIPRLDLVLATRARWEFRRVRRDLIFGDCGMVATAHLGAGGGTNPKANLRYTAKRHWKVWRRDIAPAMPIVCQNVIRANYFAGTSFSSGDQWIRDFSLKLASQGKSDAWAQAGLSHHLAFAARQAARTLYRNLKSTGQ